MPDNSHIIDKVKKLLKLAKSSNANEAATAAALANKLILQHMLDEADLNAENSDSKHIYDKNSVYTTKRLTSWKYNLLVAIAHNYGCTVISSKVGSLLDKRAETQYRLIGKETDIEVVKYMYFYLQTITEALVKINSLANDFDKGKGRIAASSYADGVVAGIKFQLEESTRKFKEEAAAANRSFALAKLDNKLKESEQAMMLLVPNIKYTKITSSRKQDADTFNQGFEKGKTIQINKGLNAAQNSVGGLLN